MAVSGTFYGTTGSGGGGCGYCCGTVFSLTAGGTKTVLHQFQGGADGETPSSGLLDDGGSLVGTTGYGGLGSGSGHGTVFRITLAGNKSLIANFPPRVGAYPIGTLTKVGARLFGVAAGLGPFSMLASVYLVTPTGKVRLIHTFGGAGDGTYPNGPLLNVGGTLYGTTAYGGAAFSQGTVFAVTPAGQETVLHSFAGSPDGSVPRGGLVAIDGTLFGTTAQSGAGNCGTVFKITPDGSFTHLHFFHLAKKDGCQPHAGLTWVNSILYGTTYSGGAYGFGTMFSITKTGVEHVVYDFQGGTDGGYPEASLLNVDGILYGTTYIGGAHGFGTVFKIVP